METSDPRALDAVSRAGRIMLQNGAEISRVEECMRLMADRLGVSEYDFFVLSNGIFTTSRSYAKAEFIPIKGARLDRVIAVNQLSRNMASAEYTVDDAEKALDMAENLPAKGNLAQTAASCIGSGAFCAIFGGGLPDCLGAAVSGALLWILVLRLSRSNVSKAVLNIAGGLLATLVCIVIAHIWPGTSLANMVIGSVIPLIPGVAFTNGVRDIANEDYIAGATRLLDAVAVFMYIALGVCISLAIDSFLFGAFKGLTPLTDSLTQGWGFQTAAALAGTAAFAVLFSVPRRYCLPSGITGMAGWAVYLAASRLLSLSVIASIFIAAASVSVMSRIAAKRMRCPRIVFLICGIFPLIPGGGIFWSLYYTVNGMLDTAAGTGLNALMATIAIALGLTLSSIKLGRRRKAEVQDSI